MPHSHVCPALGHDRKLQKQTTDASHVHLPCLSSEQLTMLLKGSVAPRHQRATSGELSHTEYSLCTVAGSVPRAHMTLSHAMEPCIPPQAPPEEAVRCARA